MIERDTTRQFKLVSKYKPAGDQPEAIRQLVEGINHHEKAQVLLGATGTGKTYTISNVIQQVNKPTLIMAHNKTLAGQLYGEFKEFFPENAVEYFVSYYDYYQPEAYVPSSDTYIEKDSSVNDEIDKLRHSATSSLLERNDVIVVASVSCIFGLGSPMEYQKQVVSLRTGMEVSREQVLRWLIDIQFERNDIDFQRGRFRVRGDVIEIFPASRDERALRVEFFGDEIDRIREVDALTGEMLSELEHVSIFPATHFMTDEDHLETAIAAIQEFLKTEIPVFGICLGHQLLGLASGAKTIKMKFGHHGGNHPVKDLDRNVVMITSQNHGFAVDEATLPANLRATHKSLFDGSLQGIHRTDKPAFSFQGHPEASPGPHDAAPLFDHFIELIKKYRA